MLAIFKTSPEEKPFWKLNNTFFYTSCSFDFSTKRFAGCYYIDNKAYSSENMSSEIANNIIGLEDGLYIISVYGFPADYYKLKSDKAKEAFLDDFIDTNYEQCDCQFDIFVNKSEDGLAFLVKTDDSTNDVIFMQEVLNRV